MRALKKKIMGKNKLKTSKKKKKKAKNKYMSKNSTLFNHLSRYSKEYLMNSQKLLKKIKFHTIPLTKYRISYLIQGYSITMAMVMEDIIITMDIDLSII